MSWGLVAVAGATVIGGAISANSAQNAADTESNAANNATTAEQNQYNQTRADTAPYRASGTAALSQLNQQLPDLTRNFSAADFQTDPGYAFNLQQGQQAIQRSAGAKGGLYSGDTMKALDSYTQGQAANQYQNAYSRFTNNQNNTFNRLQSVAQNGQAATLATDGMGQQTAASIGSNLTSAGNAQAAGQVATGNSINNAIGGITNNWMQSQMLGRGTPQPVNGYNPSVGSGSNFAPSNYFTGPTPDFP